MHSIYSLRAGRGFLAGLALLCLSFAADPAAAQTAGGFGGGIAGGGLGGFGGGLGGGAGGGAAAGGAAGAAGGAAGAAGGAGGAGGAAAGIVIDAQGVVRPVFSPDKTGALARKQREAFASRTLPQDLNAHSACRKVSLTALERACEEYADKKENVPSDMHFLAGLQRIDYVFVDPEKHDVVIAGPAEGYAFDSAGRAVGVSTGRPPIRLDDLLVALRTLERASGTMGCSIDATQSGLASLNSYLSQTSGALPPEQAVAKFKKLPEVVGMQNVRIFGVPAESHFAKAVVEADYKMKLLSIGLDQAPVKGFKSHLALVGPGENAMQRWWFAPLYEAFVKSDDSLAFAFNGQRVQLMAQEELVSADGRRSDAPFTHISSRKFAKQFTDRYQEIAAVSPMYAELQNLFDLAVLAALLKKERLSQRAGWKMELFLDPARAAVATQHVPRQVESVSNYKVANGNLYVAQVAGGVTIDPWQMLTNAEYQRDSGGKLAGERQSALGGHASSDHVWWWD